MTAPLLCLVPIGQADVEAATRRALAAAGLRVEVQAPAAGCDVAVLPPGWSASDLPIGAWLHTGGPLLALRPTDDGHEVTIDRLGPPFAVAARDVRREVVRAAWPHPITVGLDAAELGVAQDRLWSTSGGGWLPLDLGLVGGDSGLLLLRDGRVLVSGHDLVGPDAPSPELVRRLVTWLAGRPLPEPGWPRIGGVATVPGFEELHLCVAGVGDELARTLDGLRDVTPYVSAPDRFDACDTLVLAPEWAPHEDVVARALRHLPRRAGVLAFQPLPEVPTRTSVLGAPLDIEDRGCRESRDAVRRYPVDAPPIALTDHALLRGMDPEDVPYAWNVIPRLGEGWQAVAVDLRCDRPSVLVREAPRRVVVLTGSAPDTNQLSDVPSPRMVVRALEWLTEGAPGR